MNPVSTLGSMQVSISYVIAEVEKAKSSKLGLAEIWKLRDELYTRAGGVNYGTRMLLGYHAGYGSRLHVFADYNAGRYASRNAAFQHMVAKLSGADLALDGDLLIYEGGIPKSGGQLHGEGAARPEARARGERPPGRPRARQGIRFPPYGNLWPRDRAYAENTGKKPHFTP